MKKQKISKPKNINNYVERIENSVNTLEELITFVQIYNSCMFKYNDKFYYIERLSK